MKTLLSLILFFFQSLVFSQMQKDTCNVVKLHLVKQDKSEKWKVVALYSTSVILNGIGDGLNDS